MIKQNNSNRKYVEYYLKIKWPKIKNPDFLIPKTETFNNYYIRVYDDIRLSYFSTENLKYNKLKKWYNDYKKNKLHR